VTFLNTYRRQLRAAALIRGIVTEERRFGDKSEALRGVAAIGHPQNLASIRIRRLVQLAIWFSGVCHQKQINEVDAGASSSSPDQEKRPL
jgi:hypothetical protein